MTPSQYAKTILDQKFPSFKEFDKAVQDIADMHLQELVKQKEDGKLQEDKQLIPVLRELNNRYIEFAKLVNKKKFKGLPGVKETGLLSLINKLTPEIYRYYIKHSN